MVPIKIILFLQFFSGISAREAHTFNCEEEIYCRGRMLHTFQMEDVFYHSKTFVDMKMLNHPENILQNFDIFMFKHGHQPSKSRVTKFVRENFAEGDELVSWVPPDFTEKPAWLEKIENPRVKKFASDLLLLIPKLCRKVRPLLLEHPELYSFIMVPNGIVISGGSNRESYYLDSYWLIKGLLIDDMTTTVKGILDNFILMQKKYGYVPKGTRIYYCNTRQPPVLTLLVDLYLKKTNDIYWLLNNVHELDKELRHWLNYRCFDLTRNGEVYTLARYMSLNRFPRPERYYLDYVHCTRFNDTKRIEECYENVKAPGESGWFYPERYVFDDENEVSNRIEYTYPRRLVPVDLNVYLCKSFKLMSEFYERVNDYTNASYYRGKHGLWMRSIQKILYSQQDGIWFDYDIIRREQRKRVYPTNFMPLWAGLFSHQEASKLGKRALRYFKRMNMMPFRGSSDRPPIPQHDVMKMYIHHKHIVAKALFESGDREAMDYAKEFIRRWLEESMDCECCKYDMFDDIDLRSSEFRWGCGWIVLTSLDLIHRFFVLPERLSAEKVMDL